MKRKTGIIIALIIALALVAGLLINQNNQEAGALRSQREDITRTSEGEVYPSGAGPAERSFLVTATTLPPATALANYNPSTGVGTLAIMLNGSFANNIATTPLSLSFEWWQSGNPALDAKNPTSITLPVSGTTTAVAGNFSFNLITAGTSASSYRACVADSAGNKICGNPMYPKIIDSNPNCTYMEGYPVPPCLGQLSNIPKPSSTQTVPDEREI